MESFELIKLRKSTIKTTSPLPQKMAEKKHMRNMRKTIISINIEHVKMSETKT